MSKIRLNTTYPEFDAIGAVLDKVRPNTEFVKLPRDAIMHLFMDHSIMVNALGNRVEDE